MYRFFATKMRKNAFYASTFLLVVSLFVYFQTSRDDDQEYNLPWTRMGDSAGASMWDDIWAGAYKINNSGDNDDNDDDDAKPGRWRSGSNMFSFGRHGNSAQSQRMVDNLEDVNNATLGFQEAFMISLPTRKDKHDAFALQALVSNLTYTTIEGVMGDTVPSKALPHTMKLRPEEVGCWRAHMNVITTVVERKLATAIVFEDDADLDVAFRSQFLQYARGARFVTNTDINKTANFVPHSPYGNDWDVLWLGHCSSGDVWDEDRRFVILHDPTVLPPNHRGLFEQPDMRIWDGGENPDYKTRTIFRARQGTCTAAYAVSLSGAQKLIYHLSMSPTHEPIDMGMGRMCGDGRLSCISSNPPLIGISKPAGGTDRGSDVGHVPDEAFERPQASAERVMYSTRINLPNLLAGVTMVISQYPDHSPNMEMADLHRAINGTPYFITQAERKKLRNIDDARWLREEEEKKTAEQAKKLEVMENIIQDQEAKLKEHLIKITGEQPGDVAGGAGGRVGEEPVEAEEKISLKKLHEELKQLQRLAKQEQEKANDEAKETIENEMMKMAEEEPFSGEPEGK